MTLALGAAVHCIVLGAGMGFVVLLVIALHTLYVGNTQNAHVVGILTVSLLTAAPARITEDVNIGAPECQLGIAGNVVGTHLYIEDVMVGAVPVGASLIGHCTENIINQLLVERSTHTDRLREYGITALTHAVAGL